MKKITRYAFNGLNIALVLVAFLSVYVLCFRQLPVDDIHYGYGVMFFSLIIAPLIFLPLAIISAIADWAVYNRKKQHSKFYVTCFIVAAIGLVLAVCLVVFKDLYLHLNLNPQYTQTTSNSAARSILSNR